MKIKEICLGENEYFALYLHISTVWDRSIFLSRDATVWVEHPVSLRVMIDLATLIGPRFAWGSYGTFRLKSCQLNRSPFGRMSIIWVHAGNQSVVSRVFEALVMFVSRLGGFSPSCDQVASQSVKRENQISSLVTKWLHESYRAAGDIFSRFSANFGQCRLWCGLSVPGILCEHLTTNSPPMNWSLTVDRVLLKTRDNKRRL
jgi:hypothetical protein